MPLFPESAETGNSKGHAIAHLRCSGSTLFNNTTTHQHLYRYESKPNPKPIEDNAVVEAFGSNKCPRLVRLLNDKDEDILIRTLHCLKSVLKIPNNVAECCHDKLHFLDRLSKLIFHENPEIQQLAAAALSAFSSHAIGRIEIINQNTMQKIRKGFSANNELLLGHLYDTALHMSTILTGAQELTQNGYVPILLERLKKECPDTSRVKVMQLLKACVNDAIPGTVQRAVDSGGIDIVSPFITSKKRNVRVAALQVTGAMLFLDIGRERALALGLVKTLCSVLMEQDPRVTFAATSALMVLAVHDDAKRNIFEAGVISRFLQLLQTTEFGIQLNTLKLMAALACYPPARAAMNSIQLEKMLRVMSQDANELLARSAKITLRGVLWVP